MEFWGQVSGELVIFEGSLAKMLRFWSSKLHFWRNSRTKVSFLNFKASFLKEVSHKSFGFELQSVIFEGSLAQKLRFWASKLHFWRKSRTKASFLSFKASFFEGSLADMLGFWSSKLHCWRKSRRNASFLSFKASILKEVSHKNSFDKIIWITHQLTTKSFEPQIIWHPNHLNLKSIDNQLIWISNWQPNHLNLKLIDNQINWISNQVTTKVIWISNQMTTKSFDSQLVSIWHQLTFEPIELHTHTHPSYRFLIFGNFRHRLVQ